MKAVEVKAQINARIIAMLDQGEIPWSRPWLASGPRNLFSGRGYTGLNRFILALAPFSLPFWATYRQYQVAGLQVQRGETGTGIIYAGRTVKTEEKVTTEGERKEDKKVLRFLKAFTVFNVAQTDYKEKGFSLPEVRDNQELLECEAVVQEYTDREQIMITNGDRAAYSPRDDSIIIPELCQFRTSEHYYATLFHESVHSTGPRLKRFQRTDPVCFGSDTYGREELVAEIGGAYLAALTGIDSEAITRNQTAYLQNWSAAIKADKDMLLYAAGRAEKAVDFITGEPAEAFQEAAE